MKEYTTVKEVAMDEFVERKSRFIGHIKPVATEEEAIAFLQELRTKYWDANHNVFAYTLRESGIKRSSDDGEPQGTGGVPVLEVIEREGLTDVIVVVTRYFGGTLLGAGGLVRAYSHGAKIAVDAAEIIEMSPCCVIQLEFDYGLYGKLTYMLPKYHTVTLESDFGVVVRLNLMMRQAYFERFSKELMELTSDTVHPYLLEEKYAYMPEES